MEQNQTDQEHQQYLVAEVLGWMGEHYDSSRLYEIFHDEIGLSNEDIEDLGFDLSHCYEDEELDQQEAEPQQTM